MTDVGVQVLMHISRYYIILHSCCIGMLYFFLNWHNFVPSSIPVSLLLYYQNTWYSCSFFFISSLTHHLHHRRQKLIFSSSYSCASSKRTVFFDLQTHRLL